MAQQGDDAAVMSRADSPARLVVRIIGWCIAGLLCIASFWAGWTFQRTVADSNGEPGSVLVATWMRDNHMGPVVAKLEDLYYTYVDKPQVGGAPTVSADLSAEDNAGADNADLGTPTPSASASASASASQRTHLDPPQPLVSPVDTPEPMEGQWQPVASRVDGIPAVYITRVRADNVHTAYYASVMWIDTSLTKAIFIPGFEEPAGGPNPFDGALPKEYWPFVLANFNGAFRLEDTMGGYAYDGTIVKDLVKGRGTTVVYRDGSIKVGKWGRDFTQVTPDMMAVRQNLNLIVDKGQSKVTSAADNVVWGATTDKDNLAWRAAIGQRQDGSIVYVGSPYLSAQGLADTLVNAGVQRAMVLDMNNWWTAGFYFRHTKAGAPLCRKLDPQIAEGCDRFLKPYKRDSFQFVAADPGLPALPGTALPQVDNPSLPALSNAGTAQSSVSP